MTLDFPNPSRSFDAAKDRVCFWGYDRAMEVTFYVEASVLKKLCPDMGEDESGFLQAFDSVRKQIQAVAAKVYTHGRKGLYAYILVATDF